ncbi:MAG: hypothetical protein KGJ23_07030 [Euryarchaeota archaeon]|nr:hypothetical protein [Euryarchaeota archaeon]MDE1879151.1 hypothetical protein [Euryarchaeota archaeon]MDE2044251.1 hypothetical protein [Thermoplasmata archaeon]
MALAVEEGAVEELLAEVPTLPRFLSAAELDEASLALAREHPGDVRVRRFGHTAHGDALIGLEVGDGEKVALLVGAPHPNEPLGTLTALHLARALARKESLTRRLGARFFLIPAIDRDGLRLNEGWMTHPGFSLSRFAHHYYRPPARQQVEWGFPYYADAYDFSSVPPETEALAHLIDTLRPSLIFSLHNSTTGGVFYYLNRPIERLQELLVDHPRQLGLPLEPAVPEEPWGSILSPFILKSLSTHEAVQYLLEHNLDPRRVLTHGAGSIEYGESVNPNVLGMMAEVPLFPDPRSGDSTEAPVDRTSLEAERHQRRERVVNLLRSAHHTLQREGVLRPGTFRDCLESSLEFQSRREGLAPIPSPEGPVTVSEVFRNQITARFTDLRLLGTLYRFIGEQAAPGTFAREGLLRSTEDQIEHVAQGLEGNLKGRRAPLVDLVRAQMAAGLHALRYLA